MQNIATVLLTESLRCLASCVTQPIVLPQEYTQQRHTQSQGELVLTTHFERIRNIGEMRCVCLVAPKIDIITLFFFPYPQSQLPVYAMEFVVLGSRPIVAVIDAVCLVADMECAPVVTTLLQQTHANFPHIIQADEPPMWYSECRSGLDFFVRPKNTVELNELINVHLHLWQNIVRLFDASPFFVTSEPHQQAIQQYKAHHRQYTPGLRLMNHSFGEAWTQTFLADYLFF